MTVRQTVEVTANRRITLDIPRAIPEGKTILTFTPASASKVADNSPRTTAEALQMAELKAADPNRKPISRHFGVLKGIWEGDAVAYQRKLRDEWD